MYHKKADKLGLWVNFEEKPMQSTAICSQTEALKKNTTLRPKVYVVLTLLSLRKYAASLNLKHLSVYVCNIKKSSKKHF